MPGLDWCPLIIRMGKVLLYVALVYMTLHGHLEINVLLLLVTYFENIATNTRDFNELLNADSRLVNLNCSNRPFA